MDADFYDKLYKVYSRCRFDDEYINWLGKFVQEDIPSENSVQTVEYEVREYIGNIEEDSDKADGFRYEYIVGDWQYDESEAVWYLEKDNRVYLYDDSQETMYYYNRSDGTAYYYDEYRGDWELYE